MVELIQLGRVRGGSPAGNTTFQQTQIIKEQWI